MPTLDELLGYGLGATALYGALKPDSKVGEFLGMGSGQQAPIGYTGGIPEYTFTRQPLADAFSQVAGADPVTGAPIPRRPGSMGRRYFTDPTFITTGETLGDVNYTQPAGEDIDQALFDAVINAVGGTGDRGDVETSAGGEDYTEGLATDTSTQAAVDEALADTTTDTTTDTTAFNNFISGFFNKNLSKEDLVALDNSGYSTERIANALSVGLDTPISTERLQNAVNQATGLDQFGVKTTQATDALATILEEIPDRTVDYDEVTAVDRAAEAIGVTEAELVASLLQRGEVTAEDVSAAYGIPVDEIKRVFTEMGGTRQLAQGGIAQGYYLGGPTDGMADLVPATIDGMQPAALSDGEFVIPADVVSHLGNGNSEAGAQQLYSMMDRVRDERTGTTKQGPEINPMQMMPA